MAATIYLTRHAEAEGNVYRRCHGQYDSLLTERGFAQLPYLAKRFADVDISAVYASDLYRARTTAGAVAQDKGLTVQIQPILREINMGDWEDCTWAELPRICPEVFYKWQTEPWNCTPPGGESVMQAGARLFGALREIAKAHEGQNVVVVSHGSAIRGTLSLALELRPEELGQLGWGDNTCVAKIVFEGGKATPEYWNDASHLPEELSTFAAIGWKDNKGVPASPQIWFKTVSLEDEADVSTLLRFARQKYQSAYGSDEGLDEAAYIADTRAMLALTPRAVTFGMAEDVPAALVRLNVCDQSYPDTGMVGSFVIDEPYRGAGLSQQIIGQAISVYRAMGKKFLCAYVEVHNERAKAFYHKFGFRREGTHTTPLGEHDRMVKRIVFEKDDE